MAEEKDILAGNDRDAEQSAKEANDWEARYIRLAADFDNYRKRTEAEYGERTDRIRAEILRSILPAYDDFRHLLNHADGDSNLMEGILALRKSWQQWLQQFGVENVAEIGDDFDYARHEAVFQEVVNGPDMDGKVTRIIQPGYIFKDKVIRHAKVAVGRYPGTTAGNDDSEEMDFYDF